MSCGELIMLNVTHIIIVIENSPLLSVLLMLLNVFVCLPIKFKVCNAL